MRVRENSILRASFLVYNSFLKITFWVLFVSLVFPRGASAQAQKGFLDFSSKGTFLEDEYLLNGEWEFYWNQLLSPVDFESDKRLEPDYVYVPGSWSGALLEKKYPSHGYATYRLRVHLPVDPDLNDIIFNIRTIRTAYRIWVNSQTLVTSGSVSKTKAKSTPRKINHLVPFHVTKRDLDIIVQVSNHEHWAGGMRDAIAIARADRSLSIFNSSVPFDMFVIGSLFVMGLYHLGMSFFHEDRKGSLYFSLFCFAVMMRTFFMGSVLITSVFPDISYSLQMQLETFTIGISPALFLLFTRTVFQEKVNFSFFRFYILFFILASVVQFFLPLKVSGLLSIAEMALFFPPALYITIVSLQSALEKSPTGRVFFIGWLILFLSLMHDILIMNEVFYGTFIVPVGIIAFTFSQSILIAMKFAQAYKSVEDLTLQLSHTNSELNGLKQGLEKKVRDRTLELNRSLREIKTDISMAKRIQSSLFSSPHRFFNNCEIQSRYIPMRGVGGDFYDFFEMPDGRIRILVADATGHGVRGAMITIAIKAEYEPIKQLFDTPKQLLTSLNKNYLEKYNSLGSYLSAIAADFDPVSKVLTFSVAGHPPPMKISRTGEIEIPSLASSLIGLSSQVEYENYKIELEKWDRVYLYSDGLFDQFSPEKELIPEVHVLDLLRAYKEKPLGNTMESIIELQERHLNGSARSDDFTMVVLEVKDKKVT